MNLFYLCAREELVPWSELGVDIPIKVFSLAEKSLAPKAESESVAVAAIVFERLYSNHQNERIMA